MKIQFIFAVQQSKIHEMCFFVDIYNVVNYRYLLCRWKDFNIS